MIKSGIKKGTALLLTLLLVGSAACGEEPKSAGSEREITPTMEAQAGNAAQGGAEQGGNASGEEKTPGASGQNGQRLTPSAEIDATVEAVKSAEVKEDAKRTATVVLSDSGISVSGYGCKADGSCLKIKEAGTYEISGSLSDGSIYVNVDNESEVHLILNGVTIHNETSAALFCKKAAKVTVTLAEGSVNTLTDGASYVFEEGADEPDATLYAKHDLVINGTGTLKVTSAYGDAIKGKDAVYILGGNYAVDSADDGIVGRDLLYIADGTFAVESASDALKANNDTDATLGNILIDGGTFDLVAGTDGIQAENNLVINNGVFGIQTGGGSANASVKTETDRFGGWGKWGAFGQTAETETTETSASAKGLKAVNLLAVTGGTFELDTSDDTFHSDKDVTISGGSFLVTSGDDGAHADENLEISGQAKLNITKSYEGLEALNITLSGGEVSVVASDDGLNAAGGADGSGFGRPGAGMFGEGTGEIVINDGALTVNASGDGIDANGSVTVNGGVVLVYGPTNDGNGVLDYGRSFLLNGGALLCMGSSGMAQVPSEGSGQYSVAAVLTTQAAEESAVTIIVNGTEVLATKVPKRFNYILASSEAFVAEAEVKVLVNGEECYAGPLTETVTCFGMNGGMGGFGGFGGGFGGGRGGKGNDAMMPNGEVPNDEAPELPNGEMPNGEMPNGEMPKGERPKGERPALPPEETEESVGV